MPDPPLRDATAEAVAAPEDLADRAELAAALTLLRERSGMSVRALARRIGVPVGTVGGYLSGRHLPGPAQHAVLTAMLRACGVAESDIGRWLAAVVRIRRAPGPRAADQPSPYPGLASFQPDDAPFFFGRAGVTDQVLALIDRAGDPAMACGLVTVVGPSGSGKSSLLNAGVIPAVRGAGHAAIQLAPGEHPAAALVSAIAEHLGLATVAARAVLTGDADGLAGCLARGGRTLLVIDQAEELFTLCADPAERREFFHLLDRMVATVAPSGRRAVVAALGLRGDLYAAAATEPTLLPALRDAQVLLGSMSRQEMVQVITGPAAAVGLHVEDGLLQMLLDDLAPRDAPGTAHDAGALPLLAHALRETWRHARRGRMTVADYLATGGIGGAVERTAEAVWSELGASDRALARRILLRLVLVGDDATVTRRRVHTDELVGLEPDGAVAALIDRFVQARLLTVRRETVEISHEALLVAWTRLHDWVAADRSGLRLHRQLADAARAWRDSGRDPSYLLRGNRLAAMSEWLDAEDAVLNAQEQDFLRAGIAERAAGENAEHRRRRRLRQALVVAAVLAVLASGLAIFGFRASALANDRAAEAALARDQAQSRELAIAADRLRDTDPALAAQLALIAYRTSPTVDGRSALLDNAATPAPSRIPAQQGPTSVALDARRHLLAVTGARDGSVTLWSVARVRSPARVVTVPSAQPGKQQFSVAIRPDGRELAVGNEDGLIQRWDIADPAHPVALPGPGKAFPTGVLSLAYGPDGRTLVGGGAGGAVLRWEIPAAGRASPLPSLPASAVVGAVAFSPGGSLLWAGGDDGAIRAWPATGFAHGRGDPRVISAGSAQVNAIAVNADGTLVATGDKSGQVALWRRDAAGTWVRRRDAIPPMTGWVSTLAFSPDGTRLAVGTTGNQVTVLDTAGLATAMSVQSPGPVTSVLFDGPGTVIAAATDGYVRAWPVPGPVIGPVGASVFGLGVADDRHVLVAPGSAVNEVMSFDVGDPQRPVAGSPASPVAAPGDAGVVLDGALALAPNGRLAAEGTRDGRVQLWNVSDPDRPAPIGPAFAVSADLVEQMAFSPDGRMLAVGADDERVRLWDVADPAAPRELASTDRTGGQVYSVAFQPGGNLLAGATTAGAVALWNISDPRQPRRVGTLPVDGYAQATVFSPDGAVLAAAGAGRLVYRWDVSDPAHPRALGRPLAGPTNNINMISFTANGSRLAAVTGDGVAWVWDAAESAAPALWARLRAGRGVLYALALSPDGSRLVAGGSTQQVWIWDLDPDAVARQTCAAQGTGITRAEWALYVQGMPYRPPCG